MFFQGKSKWTNFIVAITLALFCVNAPTWAASASKKKSSTHVQKKTKKSSPKQSKKTSQKKSKQKKSRYDGATKDWLNQLPKSPSDSTKYLIDSSDPKAFTIAIMLEKEGLDFEMVDPKSSDEKAALLMPPKPEEPKDFFDFSSMLLPVTHEALLGSKYGIRDHRLHRGVDVNVIKDEPVVAAYPGTVIVSKYNKGGYGHYVLIEHPNGLQTLYGHLSERALKVGDQVFPGDIVGLAGNTGKSSAAHLHFEMRYGDINIDPATIINFPKWELQPNVDHISKKKLTSAHYSMQSKLKKENIYIVLKGDTISDVAMWFNISEDAVIRINKLKKGVPLKPGQVLRGCQ